MCALCYASASLETFPEHDKAYTFSINMMPAAIVPPVAIRSSTSSTRCPSFTAPTCISILSVPYSSLYSAEIVSPGPRNVCYLLLTSSSQISAKSQKKHFKSFTILSASFPPGSFPGFLSGTKPTPSRRARGAPNIKPLASKPANLQG